jgi:PAS domain S-box-containing protein
MKQETERSRILIVDDDDNFRAVTAACLKNEGYRVETASTGGKAVEKVSSKKPEIVLLDLILPDIEGTEVLKRIRQTDRNVAVITITGYGDQHRAVNVMKAGSCDYLTKPFNLTDLLQSVEKASMWRQIQIVEHMSEGYLAIDKTRVVYANRVVDGLLGYSRNEIAGMDTSRLFSKKDLPLLRRRRDEVDGVWQNSELKAIHRDGTMHTLETRIGGDTFQGRKVIAAIFKDITTTKNLEAALEETQSLYEHLIKSANDAITLINREGTFALVNPKFCEISGFSEEETKSLHFSKLIHPDDLPLFTDRYRRALAGENVPSNYQFRMIRKTGEIIFIDFNANAIKKEGRIFGIQAIARDITERKHAENERQDRMKELEKWHKLTVDRELRMVELKKKIVELETQLAHLKKLKGIE